jgi:hypothetical protein
MSHAAGDFSRDAILEDVARREEWVVDWHRGHVGEAGQTSTAGEQLAEPLYGSRVTFEQTGQALQESRLAGTLLSDNSDHVSARNIEIDVFDCALSAMVFREAAGERPCDSASAEDFPGLECHPAQICRRHASGYSDLRNMLHQNKTRPIKIERHQAANCYRSCGEVTSDGSRYNPFDNPGFRISHDRSARTRPQLSKSLKQDFGFGHRVELQIDHDEVLIFDRSKDLVSPNARFLPIHRVAVESAFPIFKVRHGVLDAENWHVAPWREQFKLAVASYQLQRMSDDNCDRPSLRDCEPAECNCVKDELGAQQRTRDA